MSELELRTELYEHQTEGLAKMIRLERTERIGAVLADDMGLGKTIQILGLVVESLNKHPDGQTLVVCPVSVITQWRDEITRHTTIPDEVVHVYYATGARFIPGAARVVITSYGMVVRDWKTTGGLAQTDWRRVVLDEAHLIRNQGTKMFKACNSLKRRFGWAMTGTPLMNKLEDLNSLIVFCRIPVPVSDPRAKARWIKEAGMWNPRGLDEWRERYIIRRMRCLLRLPPIEHLEVSVKFCPEERREYLAVLKYARSAFEKWMTSSVRTLDMFTDILVKLLRLRQCCDHPGLKYLGIGNGRDCILCGNETSKADNSNVVCEIHKVCRECVAEPLKKCHLCEITEASEEAPPTSSKIDKIMELIERHAPDGKIVVFSQWLGMLDMIKTRCKSAGIRTARLDGTMDEEKKTRQLRRFKNKSKVRVFLASMMAGGVGLNLTQAKYAIVTDPWWNPFVEEQAAARLHRIGQTQPVTIYTVSVQHSIEEWMHELQRKKKLMASVFVGKQSFCMQSAHALNAEDLGGLFDFLANKRELV